MSRHDAESSVETTLEFFDAPLAPVSLSAPSARAVSQAVGEGGSSMVRLETRRHIGRGGMGDIHAAHDPLLGRDVAIKVMLTARSSGVSERFATEAQVTAQLDHPNIVPVYDARLAGDQLSYSMKLVTGATLGEILSAASSARAHGERLPEALQLDALLDIFGKICDAIAYAHRKGVVHRDLKPENVMVGAHGAVYVMDWGLARVMGDADVQSHAQNHKTLPGFAIGTAPYMAPEQARGEEMGPAVDQYALGLILYEMVCGRPARPRDGDLETALDRAARGWRRPIAAVRGQRVRRELAAIIHKATQPWPTHRYRSVRAMADDIRRFRNNLPVEAAPDSLLQKMQRWVSTHREATLALVFLLVLLLGLAGAGVVGMAAGGASVYASWAEARQERVTRLVTQVGSRAAELEQTLAQIRGQVEAVSAASQALMEHGDRAAAGEVLAPSAFQGDARPADTAWSKSYQRPISTAWPDVVIAPGVDRRVAVEQAQQLVPIRQVMRRAHIQTRQRVERLDERGAERRWRDEPGPIRWAIVGTPEGLYLEMPGAAWDASGFDGRLRPWYTLAQSTEPTWGEPYPESSSGTLLVACSAQIPSEDGGVLGVASLSISFSYLAERFLTIDHPAVEETFLVDRRARILMRSGQEDPLQRPADLRDTFETPPFPDPALAPALVSEAGSVSAADGDLLLHYPLNNGWWFVARVDPGKA